MDAPNYQPYREGDFLGNLKRKTDTYRGPIFSVTYPSSADPMNEEHAWHKLGYMTRGSFSHSPGSFTIMVMGDIPEEIQTRFRKRGIGVEMTKPRGPVIDI